MPNILVIGYGNELRSDDGLGPKIAAAIEQEHMAGVQVITAHQLTPELAEPISAADAVIFIDAAIQRLDRVKGEGLDPSVVVRVLSPGGVGSPEAQFRAHGNTPELLMGLAVRLFGKCPPGWSITVPAADFGFGETLSASAQAAVPLALLKFQELWRSLSA